MSNKTSKISKPSSPSPLHQRLKVFWQSSQTKLLSGLYGIPSGILAVCSYADQAMSDDHVQMLLDRLHIPAGVFTILAILAIFHYVAHGHAD